MRWRLLEFGIATTFGAGSTTVTTVIFRHVALLPLQHVPSSTTALSVVTPLVASIITCFPRRGVGHSLKVTIVSPNVTVSTASRRIIKVGE